jgi:preprotein translocase subunit SecY
MYDEDRPRPLRLGLAGGFDDRYPSDHRDLQRRLLFTLGVLFVYRIGVSLPIPGLSLMAARAYFDHRPGIAGLLNASPGGAMERVSIFAFGIMPYVSACIIVQLASSIIPQLGSPAAGERPAQIRLNQYARILAVVLAGFQALNAAFALRNVPGLVATSEPMFEITTVVTLIVGTILLIWLAEQISARGLGNGVVIILAVDYLLRIVRIYAAVYGESQSGDLAFPAEPVMAAAFLALVVLVESARWRAPFGDPRHENGPAARRINPAGVLPALAAVVFTAPLWQSISTIGGTSTPVAGYFSGFGYLLLFAILTAFFTAYFDLSIFSLVGPPRKLLSGSLRPAFAVIYVTSVCVLPLLFYRWRHSIIVVPTGFQIFLLGWVAIRIVERVRADWQS